ncbi:protoporphyrinogen oxidase [Nostoc sp. PCC 7524]|uniref:FAD-dependent oxidoreductase n=1 Tax=Nostoc sp. (strain ATCC 29411 / PCC 7524) TaxID=28072 RepID=UPI00029EE677|nr:FAD-dependent oxidoreductase [Nostoc sp. PCC 7524]AFY47238.1 protoporphyrinogen oxidase [Nostoc sp. PCC 7524]
MVQTKLDKNTKFGIIGAGVAGLTAARALRDKGYQNITLLEREATAGGKCRTVFYQNRPFELGAVVIAPNHYITLDIMKEVGLKTELITGDGNFYKPDGRKIKLIDKKEQANLLWQIFIKLPYFAYKNKKIYSPGFLDINSELYQNFHDYCSNNGLEMFEILSNIICTPYGYGYPHTVPAAYYFKYLSLKVFYTAFMKRLLYFSDGAATVWQKLAEKFDIRFEQNIIAIKRCSQIQVHTAVDTFEFDKLILACPLDNTLSFLNASLEEEKLFKKIRYNYYYVFLLFVNNLPDGDNLPNRGYIPVNFTESNEGHLMFWHRRYKDINLYTFYILGDEEQDEKELERVLIEDLEKMGAKVENKYTSTKWKFFPHVSCEDIQNDYYQQLESIQGENNTYFTGELLNFSIVESVAQYSYNLVERFF